MITSFLHSSRELWATAGGLLHLSDRIVAFLTMQSAILPNTYQGSGNWENDVVGGDDMLVAIVRTSDGWQSANASKNQTRTRGMCGQVPVNHGSVQLRITVDFLGNAVH